MQGRILAAAIIAAPFLAAAPAEAKPLKVCFKTADGKHYLERGNAGGHVRAVATRCKGNAVFLVHSVKDKKRTPRFGEPVTLLAQKTERYVWMNRKKKAAFASRKKVNKRDKRYFFQINSASGGGGGAPISTGDRVSIKSYVKGAPAFVPNGGGKALTFGNPPKYKDKWGTFVMVAAWRR